MRKQIMAIALGACLVAELAAAQQPPAVNARVVTRSAEGNLQQAFSALVKEQADAAWVGYFVPVASGATGSPGNDGWSERCRLEQTGTTGGSTTGAAGPEIGKTISNMAHAVNHQCAFSNSSIDTAINAAIAGVSGST